MPPRTFRILAILPLLLAALADAQPVINVSPCGNDAWSGSNSVCIAPNGPKRTIQAAVNAAADGSIIRLSAGVFVGDINVSGRRLTIESAGGPNQAFVVGTGNGRVITAIGAAPAGAGPALVVRGLTITGGRADFGSGAVIDGASALVENCVFTDNRSTQAAGALSALFAPITVRNTVFNDNSAQDFGGGAMSAVGLNAPENVIVIEGCTFTNNTATGPGAIETAGHVVVRDSLFENNRSTGTSVQNLGGAIGTFFGGRIEVEHSRFVDNSAATRGGAIGANNAERVDISHSEFTGNSAPTRGGAVWVRGVGTGQAVFITNSLFADNTFVAAAREDRTGLGSAIEVDSVSSLITNCTVVGNASPAVVLAGGQVRNSIFWNNGATSILAQQPLTASHSIVQGGFSGTAISTARPLFVGAGDYRLRPGSAAIDAGNNALVPDGVTTDLDGNPRFVDDPGTRDRGTPGAGHDAVVDLGAYEFQGTTCVADLAPPFGTSDIFDVLFFLELFDARHPAADVAPPFNTWDIFDVLAFLETFDAGCP